MPHRCNVDEELSRQGVKPEHRVDGVVKFEPIHLSSTVVYSSTQCAHILTPNSSTSFQAHPQLLLTTVAPCCRIICQKLHHSHNLALDRKDAEQ
jgi:hypothetical protein